VASGMKEPTNDELLAQAVIAGLAIIIVATVTAVLFMSGWI
jgi:preprotein translocase subunit Sss1